MNEQDDYPLIPIKPDPWLTQPEPRGSYWETMPGLATIAAAVGLLIAAGHALFGPDGACR